MEFTVTCQFNANPKIIFDAWLNGEKHGKMIGSNCTLSGNEFTAWDGYILSKNIETKEHDFIKQFWRTVEFEENQQDSVIEIKLKKIAENKTELTLFHYNLKEADIKYKQGWINNYFEPMTDYFNGL